MLSCFFVSALNNRAVSIHFFWLEDQEMPDQGFTKVDITYKGYHLINKKGNLAYHARLGFANNVFSPFSPYVLDGFVNVRGIGNRVARGTAEVCINTEYRQELIEHKWFILQGVGFTDIASLRDAGAVSAVVPVAVKIALRKSFLSCSVSNHLLPESS